MISEHLCSLRAVWPADTSVFSASDTDALMFVRDAGLLFVFVCWRLRSDRLGSAHVIHAL